MKILKFGWKCVRMRTWPSTWIIMWHDLWHYIINRIDVFILEMLPLCTWQLHQLCKIHSWCIYEQNGYQTWNTWCKFCNIDVKYTVDIYLRTLMTINDDGSGPVFLYRWMLDLKIVDVEELRILMHLWTKNKKYLYLHGSFVLSLLNN